MERGSTLKKQLQNQDAQTEFARERILHKVIKCVSQSKSDRVCNSSSNHCLVVRSGSGNKLTKKCRAGLVCLGRTMLQLNSGCSTEST